MHSPSTTFGSKSASETSTAQTIQVVEATTPVEVAHAAEAITTTSTAIVVGEVGNTNQTGTTAHQWKATFQTVLGAEYEPEKMKAVLEAGITDRLWAQLTDAEGVRFVTFESFCSANAPYGLGTDPDEVKHVLVTVFGERAAARLALRGSCQGARELPAIDGEKSEKPKPLSRTEQRLAAVNRAAPVVKALYDEGVIGLIEAANLGPASTTKKAAVAPVVEKIEALAADRSTMPEDEFAQKVHEVIADVTEPPEPVTSVHHDLHAAIAKVIAMYLPDGGMVLDTSTTTDLSNPGDKFELLKAADVAEDENLVAIYADVPDEITADQLGLVVPGGVVITSAQLSRKEGVLVRPTPPSFDGFDLVDEIVVTRRATANDKKSPRDHVVIAHSYVWVSRRPQAAVDQAASDAKEAEVTDASTQVDDDAEVAVPPDKPGVKKAKPRDPVIQDAMDILGLK